MHVVVITLTVIASILMIGVVLIQKSKGGGLSSQFGGANQVMGVRRTNDFIEKATWWIAGAIC
ncbi:preprotein translocase subunit SecG, partial [uncultured Muribaculum sp.]